VATPAVSLDALEAEIEEAVRSFRAGRPLQSVKQLRSVRRRAERLVAVDPSRAQAIRARTLMSESAPVYDMEGDLDGALQLLTEAEQTAEMVPAPDTLAGTPPLVPLIRGQKALMLLRAGRSSEALKAFDAAVEVLDQAPLLDQAIVLLNRGVLLLEVGEGEAARKDLERSAARAAEGGQQLHVAMARHNLWYADFLA
jgi:tetratricopeptide (TPR) repeat protein